MRGPKLEPFEVIFSGDPAIADTGAAKLAVRKYKASRNVADLADAFVPGMEPARIKVRPLTQMQRLYVEAFTGTRAHVEALRVAFVSATGVERENGSPWLPKLTPTAFKTAEGVELEALDGDSLAELEAAVGPAVVDEIGEVVLDEAYLRHVPTSRRAFGQRRG